MAETYVLISDRSLIIREKITLIPHYKFLEAYMYDFSWHQRHSEKTRASANAALSILIDIFNPKHILDVGCGDGIWLQKAGDLGFIECKGVDGPWTDVHKLLIPAQNVVICDLEKSFDLSRRFDIAISLEVAEHISKNLRKRWSTTLLSIVMSCYLAPPYHTKEGFVTLTKCGSLGGRVSSLKEATSVSM